ncbi:MAG TPA: response regulator [Fimbriimonas sp.]|nr:response regulator [Fimbriimonas sp.]
MTLVVVEDSDDDANMTLRGLRKLTPQPEIELIADGATALHRLLEQPCPSLVFLDLKLPKVHGFDILAGVRANKASADLQVVVFTSSDEPNDVRRANELGCCEYVKKPIEWDRYIRLVCRTAAKHLPGTYCPDGDNWK